MSLGGRWFDEVSPMNFSNLYYVDDDLWRKILKIAMNNNYKNINLIV